MNVKECVIKIIPSKCIQNSVTSHQLHCSHQYFSHAIVMVSDLLPDSHPLLFFCALFSPGTWGSLQKCKLDHNFKTLPWLSMVKAKALCGLDSTTFLTYTIFPFSPSTLATLSCSLNLIKISALVILSTQISRDSLPHFLEEFSQSSSYWRGLSWCTCPWSLCLLFYFVLRSTYYHLAC